MLIIFFQKVILLIINDKVLIINKKMLYIKKEKLSCISEEMLDTMLIIEVVIDACLGTNNSAYVNLLDIVIEN